MNLIPARAAAITAALTLASSSFAGYTITAAAPTPQGSHQAVILRATNDGIGTGTMLKALDLTFTITGGKAYFLVDDTDLNGIPDTVNIPNGGNNLDFGFVRVGGAGGTFVVSASPTMNPIEPNPWTSGVNQFSTLATTTSFPNATGPTSVFARLVLDPGAEIFLTGFMGGDVGNKVPVSFSTATSPPTDGATTIVNDNASTDAVFGTYVSSGAPFSIVINGTDPDPGDVMELVVGALPVGITNLMVSPSSSLSPAAFTVSGIVDYSLNGTTVVVPITLRSNTGIFNTDTGTFNIVVTPEPGSLASLFISLAMRQRRRR